jgi:tRNA dimethylallyltransferase
MSSKTVIIIAGPTASGKTELAIELANYFNTSIISADSRQCFRELNIGVAKPDPDQLQAVKHYFINSHSVYDAVNASVFENLSLKWCQEIFTNSDVAIMCGGTGLYIKAFCDGLDEIPAIDEMVRLQILKNYNERGKPWLQKCIREMDLLYVESGEMENPQRMMRALEVLQTTGRSITSFQNQGKKIRPFQTLIFGLHLNRKTLYDRINVRVDKMMESGLLAEVFGLLPLQHLNALQTVGYKELFDYLQGRIDLSNAVSLIKQNTRHYAKRQMTWFGKDKKLIWLEKDYLKTIIDAYASTKISVQPTE